MMRQLFYLLAFCCVTDYVSGEYPQYEGCYDLVYALEKNYHHYVENASLSTCSELCLYRWKTLYAGVEKRDGFCYCGADIPHKSEKSEEALCNIECEKPGQTCGGDSVMSVYKIQDTQPVIQLVTVNDIRYDGCYSVSYAVENDLLFFIDNITLDACLELCARRSNKYAGVEKQDSFCYCGDDLVEKSEKTVDSQCNATCEAAGYPCGGDSFMSLYDLTSLKLDVEDSPEESVGILLALDDTASLYNTSHLSVYENVSYVGEYEIAVNVDYHLAKNLVFVHTGREICKSSLTGKPVSSGLEARETVTHVNNSMGFAVDWVHDTVYFSNGTEETVKICRVGLDGSNPQTVHETERWGRNESDDRDFVTRMEVDPYAGKIFWIQEGVLESCDTQGKNFKIVVFGKFKVRAFTLDLNAQRIYYSLDGSNTLESIGYNGEDPQEHLSVPQMYRTYGLGVHNGHVYWVNFADFDDIVYKAPLDQKEPSGVKLMKVIDPAVYHMKVVHPDLQKPPVAAPAAAPIVGAAIITLNNKQS